MKKHLLFIISGLFIITGCAGAGGPEVFERASKRQMKLMRMREPQEILEKELSLMPSFQTQTKADIEITISTATRDYLNKFFENKEMFGKKKKNPYMPYMLVFYMKIKNNRANRISFNLFEFTLIDDKNGQHAYLLPEYIVASKGMVKKAMSVTQTGERYAPGLYSTPFNVTSWALKRPEKKRLELISRVAIDGGYLYNGIIYDGFIAFPYPSEGVKKLQLLIPNIKTAFNKNDEALDSVDFEFEFEVNE